MSVRSPDLGSPDRLSRSSAPRALSPQMGRSFAAYERDTLASQLQYATAVPSGAAYSASPLARSVGGLALDASVAGNGGVDGDVSRVQLLLRMIDLEKRLHRADDRLRLQEDATKQRLAELHSNNAAATERTSTIIARISEVELSSREAEIGVQSLEQRVAAESDALAQLRSHVHLWREESKRELRDEFNKNISLRNATHHQELVSLMDKQQEQQSKLSRAHEMTTQAVHTKLHALEAKWQSRVDTLDQKLASQAHVIDQWREKAQKQELTLQKLQHQHEQQLAAQAQQTQQLVQTLIEAQVAPIQQQLLLLSQLHEQQTQAHNTQLQAHYTQLQTHASQMTTIHSQLEYASTHLQEKSTALESAIQQVKDAQHTVQSNILSVSDSLTASLTNLKEVLPTRADLATVETRLATSVTQLAQSQTDLESHVSTAIAGVESHVSSELSRTSAEVRSQVQELRDDDVTQLRTAVAECAHGLEQHRKIARRTTHSIQLVEEQLAAVQAKVLVASETAATSFPLAAAVAQAAPPGSPIHALARFQATNAGLASPPPAPYQSPFTLALHLSDAAGLKSSPTQATSGGYAANDVYRPRAASPPRGTYASPTNRAPPPPSTHAEDDFIASFLGTQLK